MDAGTGGAEEARRGEGRGQCWEWWRVAQGGSPKVGSGGTEEAGGGEAEPLRAMWYKDMVENRSCVESIFVGFPFRFLFFFFRLSFGIFLCRLFCFFILVYLSFSPCNNKNK